MTGRDSPGITREKLSGPHIRGRRIGVRQIAALVEERGLDPETVADRYDLDVAEVYHALAYDHDHPREMSEVEAERVDAFESIEDAIDRPEGVSPDSG